MRIVSCYIENFGGLHHFSYDFKDGLNIVYDSWSNGKTIVQPLIRESIGLGNQAIINRLESGENITINTPGVSKYDALL